MGARSTQLASAGANAKAKATINIENTNITAVGATIQTAAILPTDTFVEIFILNGSDADSAIGTKLASGYIGSGVGIGWQGNHKGEASQWINITAWGLTACTINIGILTE
jgi:hypothetical protein